MDFIFKKLLELPNPRFIFSNSPNTRFIQTVLVDMYEQCLMRSQYFLPAALAEVQKNRLKRLLVHAQKEVPFYSAQLAGNATPLLSSISPVSKSDLREAFDKGLCISQKFKHFGLPEHTSGSTGVPLHFLFDKRAIPRARARYRRMVRWIQKTNTDLVVRLIPDDHPWIVGEGKWLLCRDPKDVEGILPALTGFASGRALIIQSRTTNILRLAQLIESKSLQITIRGFISYGEQLYYPVRNYIEQVTRAPVFDFYACNEIGGIGFECNEHDGFHVISEVVHVEIFEGENKIDKPGVAGDVVVTSLDNFVMPFIRYKTGDRGRWLPGSCKCGVSSSRLLVEGRDNYAFLLPNGEIGHFITLGWAIATMAPKIIKYQVIRRSPINFELRIVPTPRFKEADEELFINRMRQYLGPEAKIYFECVSDIEKSPGGKTYAFINLHPDY